jgi:hypothetical protein
MSGSRIGQYSSMPEINRNIVVRHNRQCQQVFFIFTGVGGQLLRMSPLEFLRESGLTNRNIIVFRDPHVRGYRQGISEDIPDLPALYRWQREFCETHPHIREVYCVGVSAGAAPAILAGHHLEAKTVWSFSARSPSGRWRARNPGSHPARPAGRRQSARRQLQELAMRLRKISNTTARERYRPSMLDLQLIDDAAATISQHNDVTEYRLYYSSTNQTDARIHGRLAGCPGVQSFPVVPPPDSPGRFWPGWDHLVLQILREKGQLGELFPPFA